MFLSIDTETGGIGLDKSLLTAYLLVFDDQFNEIAELDLILKPNDGIYTLSAEGMGINKINIVENDAKAITYKQAGTTIYDFLKKYSNQGADKLVCVGQGVKFDVLQITDKLVSEETFNQFCKYRVLDTGTICIFYQMLGILPKDLEGSLKSLSEYYGINVEGELHTARADARIAMPLLKCLMKEVKK